MHLIKPITFLLLPIFFLASCKTGLKYNYAIRDFRQALQPALTEIVSKGIVDYEENSYEVIRTKATNDELRKLVNCEHPVLRSLALGLLGERPGINKFDLLIHHLDDTAIVQVDNGEFGTDYSMVSDRLIDDTWRENRTYYDKIVKTVITDHNYLASAYTMLEKIKDEPEYYPIVKSMLFRERPFKDLEYALIALARYKRREDIPYIRQFLLDGSNTRNLTGVSFALMEVFPDTAYMEVLEKYGRYYFQHNIYWTHDVVNAGQYISALASYKNSSSAELLSSILNIKTVKDADVSTSYLKGLLINKIRNDSCAAYSTLIKKIRPEIIEYDRSVSNLPQNERLNGIHEAAF